MKKILRQQILKIRKNQTTDECNTINTDFTKHFIQFFDDYCQTYTPQIIGGYVSIHNEINVFDALKHCRDMGYKTALPFCHGKNTDLTYHAFDGDMTTLSRDSLGIASPNPNTQIIIPDVIICPSIGVCSHTQKRLGYGGGFFDKYAQQYPHIHFIGGFCEYQIIDNPDIFKEHDLQFFHIFNLQSH